MKNKTHCSGCAQKDTCRNAYEKLGKLGGPNVAMKAIVAFLIPIGIFIGTLAASQHLLRSRLEEKTLILVSFVLAVCITLLVVSVIRAVSGPVNKEQSEKGQFHDGNSW